MKNIRKEKGRIQTITIVQESAKAESMITPLISAHYIYTQSPKEMLILVNKICELK